MKSARKTLGLVLLLIAAQQAAVVHELSHVSALRALEVRLDSAGSEADRACGLCPAFAQVVTPAFSHAFHLPLLVRAEAQRSPDPRAALIDAAVPTPRSRGPPSSS